MHNPRRGRIAGRGSRLCARPCGARPAAAYCRGAKPARNPRPFRIRCHPRLPHPLPHSAGHRGVVESGACRSVGPDRGVGSVGLRHRPHVQSDGGRRTRSALGAYLRRFGGGRAAQCRFRCGSRPRLSGRRSLEAGPDRGLCQAFRRLRRRIGRPGLSVYRAVGARFARNLSAAFQGMCRCRCGKCHVGLQRYLRHAGLGQCADAGPDSQKRVGIRRLRAQRLERRDRIAGARHSGRRRRGGRQGADCRRGYGDDVGPLPDDPRTVRP